MKVNVYYDNNGIDINKAIEDIIIESYFLENQSFTGEKIKDV